MPILQVEVVGEVAERATLAQRLANAAADALETRPGGAWVRLRDTPAADYAENGPTPSALPVFVSLLLGDPPKGEARAAQAKALAAAIATATARPPERVHILYEPPAQGRIAFGGDLLA